MNVPLILDTCVFFDQSFLHKLRTYHGQKIIPVVAYVELSIRYIVDKKKDSNFVDRLLRKLDIKIERLDKNYAKNAVMCCNSGKDFKENYRDFLIGAHAFPAPRTMVTNNKKDFYFVSKVYDAYEMCQKI